MNSYNVASLVTLDATSVYANTYDEATKLSSVNIANDCHLDNLVNNKFSSTRNDFLGFPNHEVINLQIL